MTGSVAPDADARQGRTNRFRIGVAAAVVAGFALRMVHLFAFDHQQLGGDGLGYVIVANRAGEGLWFVNPLADVPDALHPPMWTLVLSLMNRVGLHELVSYQIFASVIGAATIVVVALVGRRVAGERAGLIAAAIAAIYPGLWMYERIMLSETLLFLLVGITLLAVFAFRDRPSTLGAAGLGLLVGVLALTRSEELLVAAFIVVPVLLGRRAVPLAKRLAWLVLAGAVAVAAIAPWTLYNRDRFARPVYLSNGSGQVLLIGNCDKAYDGPTTGWFDDDCLLRVGFDQPDQSIRDSMYREEGLRRARENLDRLPVVVVARVGRTFGFWAPFQQTDLEWEMQGTGPLVPRAGLVMYWLMLPLAAYGVVLLRRRGVPVYPLLGFAGIVLVTTIVTLGESRYRAAVEVPLVVLAAVALDALARRWRAAPADTPTDADADADGDTPRRGDAADPSADVRAG